MNYYLKCNCCGAKHHIAKTSSGYLPIFEMHPHIMWEDAPGAPTVRSTDDIKSLVDSGGWTIVNELGDALDWDEFEDEVIYWHGGYGFEGEPVPVKADGMGKIFTAHEDMYGHVFCDYAFD